MFPHKILQPYYFHLHNEKNLQKSFFFVGFSFCRLVGQVQTKLWTDWTNTLHLTWKKFTFVATTKFSIPQLLNIRFMVFCSIYLLFVDFAIFIIQTFLDFFFENLELNWNNKIFLFVFSLKKLGYMCWLVRRRIWLLVFMNGWKCYLNFYWFWIFPVSGRFSRQTAIFPRYQNLTLEVILPIPLAISRIWIFRFWTTALTNNFTEFF